MKRLVTLSAAGMLTFASLASAEGINLSWNDCGLFGQQNANFACNTNTGLNTAIASFIAPAGGLAEYLGLNAQLDIKTSDPTVPQWWSHGSTSCRGTTGLSVSFDFTAGPFNCIDFFSGQAAGGFAYDVGFFTPDRARFRLTCAVPFDNRGPIDDVSEWYAFKTNFLRAKTTGAGSCAGCLTPACIVFNEIQLFQPPEQNFDPVITNPADRNFVTWQGGSPQCPLSTPTQSKTWGQVRALYR